MARFVLRLAVIAGVVIAGVSVAEAAPHRCFGRAATHLGTPGPDVILGTPGPDVIMGLGGDDTISGAGGDDRVCGGDGDDYITGGTENDRLSGDGGSDVLVGQLLELDLNSAFAHALERNKKGKCLYGLDVSQCDADRSPVTVTVCPTGVVVVSASCCQKCKCRKDGEELFQRHHPLGRRS